MTTQPATDTHAECLEAFYRLCEERAVFVSAAARGGYEAMRGLKSRNNMIDLVLDTYNDARVFEDIA